MQEFNKRFVTTNQNSKIEYLGRGTEEISGIRYTHISIHTLRGSFFKKISLSRFNIVTSSLECRVRIRSRRNDTVNVFRLISSTANRIGNRIERTKTNRIESNRLEMHRKFSNNKSTRVSSRHGNCCSRRSSNRLEESRDDVTKV